MLSGTFVPSVANASPKHGHDKDDNIAVELHATDAKQESYFGSEGHLAA
jgi:hypothetical protein